MDKVNIYSFKPSGGGSGTLQSIIGGTNITIDNTDPANPIINTTADDITVVANYAALPVPGVSNTGKFYWASASQGTRWLPGSLGGTYYSEGLYYSNGVSWEYLKVPYQATQAEVDAGVESTKFVIPATLASATTVVHTVGNETVAGVKTFTSDVIVPDEVYDATAWNGSLEVPTKNAIRDKIETLGGGGITIGTTTITGGTDDRVLFDNAGVVGEDAGLKYAIATTTLTTGFVGVYGVNSRNGGSSISLDGGAVTFKDSYGLAFGIVGAKDSLNKYWMERYGIHEAVANLNAATLTITLSHRVLTVQYTATGAVTITLPAASDAWNATYSTGSIFTIKDTGCNAGTNNITINRAGSDTIITTTTGNTSVVMATNGQTVNIRCINATTWIIE